jgi:hypothetical protein
MSFIASMVAASAASAGLVTAGGIGAAALGAAATGAAGAGIGAGVSALTGGDIGEGALMGGIGGLGAGAGAALSGATMGASAIGAQGAAATPFAAAAPVASTATATAAPTATATAAPVVENAGLQSSGVVTQGLGANTTPITGEVTSGSLTAPGTINSVVAPATNPALTSAANPAPVVQGPVQASQGALDPTTFAAKNVAANEANASWGSQLLSKAGIADAGQTGNAIGGKALENAVYGAGINGLLAGAQGQDVGKAMGRGAISGGIGGAAAGGLGQMGGSIGEFATAHPNITSGAIGMGANMALSRMMPDSSDNGMPESSPLKSNYRWNPDAYNAYLPRGNSFGSFAAGGITDLDNYDQAPQMQNPGTLDIPNRNEVSNNQGYMGDSVQLMAHGGISDLGGYSDGGRLLKGPGDGVSDDIPASIGGKQPARLAEGEFVIPARIVSELGNGSTDAGAKRLYQMMDRIQSDRRKTTGKGKFSDDPKAYKHLPA